MDRCNKMDEAWLKVFGTPGVTHRFKQYTNGYPKAVCYQMVGFEITSDEDTLHLRCQLYDQTHRIAFELAQIRHLVMCRAKEQDVTYELAQATRTSLGCPCLGGSCVQSSCENNIPDPDEKTAAKTKQTKTHGQKTKIAPALPKPEGCFMVAWLTQSMDEVILGMMRDKMTWQMEEDRRGASVIRR